MNATELLANTLSPGQSQNLCASNDSDIDPLLAADANTRQDATQKLETASRENYVRAVAPFCPYSQLTGKDSRNTC